MAELQNGSRALKQLAAKTVLYQRVQTVQFFQALLPILNAIVWPILLWAKPDLGVWSTLCGFAIPLLDEAVLDHFQNEWRTTAAKIQELFDCELFELDWNEMKLGPRPPEETIAEYGRKLGSSTDGLLDWYTFQFADLPVQFARIICQRSNCWWDAKLRRRYALLLVFSLVGLGVFAFLLAVASNLTLQTFVTAVMAPLAPAFIWGLRERRGQLRAADDGEILLNHAESLWEKAAGGESHELLNIVSRSLQDGIYERRRSSPVNPPFIYRSLRGEYQTLMIDAGQRKIDEFRKTRSGA